MPKYAVFASFTPQALAGMIERPGDRGAAARDAAASVGASVEALYYMFGGHDVLAIVETEDNVTQAALSVALASSGAFSSFATHPLIEPAELTAALGKAKTVAAAYRPPGS